MTGRDAKTGGGAPVELGAVISATTRWLMRAYPAPGGALGVALAQAQVRQAATVAAWLRYPTELDAELLTLLGPGGSARLDWIVGGERADGGDASWLASQVPLDAWRSWVDEVVASWAACLLTDRALAAQAVAAVDGCPHMSGPAREFRRLTEPDDRDRRAAVLVRHPDLVAPVADLHRGELVASLAAPARD
jgi:hypothetical protein